MDVAFNIAGKLVWLLLKPQNWALLLVALLCLSVWLNWRKLSIRLATATFLFFFIFTVVPVGDYLFATLEDQYPANPSIDGAVGIVVLGGSEDVAATLRHDQVQVSWGAERLSMTVALARANPHLKVLYTGGSGAFRDMGRAASESQVAARFFTELGLDMDRVTLEPDARNTTENARRSAALVDETQRWILITSATHLPRAVASFERAGWTDIIPYPVDFNARPPALGWDLVSQLDLFSIALREYIGQLAYWVSGR